MFGIFKRKPKEHWTEEQDRVDPGPEGPEPEKVEDSTDDKPKLSDLWSSSETYESVSCDADVMVSTVIRGSREDDLLFRMCSERSSQDAFSIHTYTAKNKEVYNTYRIRFYA